MRSREGCCADWPKPCPYHEGYADALEQAETELHSLREVNQKLSEEVERHRVARLGEMADFLGTNPTPEEQKKWLNEVDVRNERTAAAIKAGIGEKRMEKDFIDRAASDPSSPSPADRKD